MSHFISLLENALKSGDTSDPGFREGVYKGALRAFDKMSNGRPDRAEFRKLHGPKLAEAITLVEQKYVVLTDNDDDDDVAFDPPSGEHLSVNNEPHISVGGQTRTDHHYNGEEPPTVGFEDDVNFDGEERVMRPSPSGFFANNLSLIIGVVFVIVLVAVLFWLFV